MPALSPALGAALAAAYATQRAAQGDLGLPGEVFIDFVADTLHARAADEPAALALLERLVLSDVYLAQAGLRGDPRAVRRFFDQHEAYIRERCARLTDRSDVARDAADELLASLLTPRHGADPTTARLYGYRGLGSLRGWLKITCRRLVLDHARKRKTARADAPLDGLAAPGPGADDRLAALDGAARLRPLFVDCVTALDFQERRLLRKTYRDNLVLREIAQEYGVQPSTIFRRLGRIREKLWEGFTRRAEQELGLSPPALQQQLSSLAAVLDLDDLLPVMLVLAGALPLPWSPFPWSER